MPPFVEIDSRNLRASLRRMEQSLRRPQVVYGRASRHMRDYVRRTITLQGRKRTYVRLSHWTRGRTNRRKALITLRPFIKARHSSAAGEVYFLQRDNNWHIDQHHTGFTSPAVVNKRMVIPRAGGGILAAFMSRKASKIPAREVWPNATEVRREVTRMFATWVDGVARKTWR